MKISIKLTMYGLATVFSAWLHTGFAYDSSYPFPNDTPSVAPNPDKNTKDKSKLNLPGNPQEGSTEKGGRGTIIRIKKIVFEGNKTIPTEELEQVSNPYLNRPLTGSDLEQLRYRLTLLYVNYPEKGYISSGAVIENQDFKDGKLCIKIIEGKLTEVRVRGSGWEKSWWPSPMLNPLFPTLMEQYISDRLLGDPNEPLNSTGLQDRYFRLLNDPLIERLNGTLLPGQKPGEAILDLKVARKRPYTLELGVDNFAPPSIGGYAGRINTTVANPIGFGETINLGFNELSGGQNYLAGVDIPLNLPFSPQGTHAFFQYSNYNTVLVQPPFQQLNIKSNIINYDAGFKLPFIVEANQRLTAGFNFNIRQDVTTVSGQPLNRPGSHHGVDSETVVRAWGDYLRQGSLWGSSWAVNVKGTVSVGVDALGANITTQTGDGRFLDGMLQGAGRFSILDTAAYVLLNGALQLSDDQLLPLEKFAIGGFSTVKGYRQNYLVRDEGFYTALEFHLPVYPFLYKSARPYSVSLVPFLNYGGAWDHSKAGTNLFSTGIGIEWQNEWVVLDDAKESLSASLYWAERLTSYPLNTGTPYDLQDNGVNFQVNFKVF